MLKRSIFSQSQPHIKTRNMAMKRKMGICQFLIPATVLILGVLFCFVFLDSKAHYHNSLHLVLEKYMTKICSVYGLFSDFPGWDTY